MAQLSSTLPARSGGSKHGCTQYKTCIIIIISCGLNVSQLIQLWCTQSVKDMLIGNHYMTAYTNSVGDQLTLNAFLKMYTFLYIHSVQNYMSPKLEHSDIKVEWRKLLNLDTKSNQYILKFGYVESFPL